jgi:hypothetical protein
MVDLASNSLGLVPNSVSFTFTMEEIHKGMERILNGAGIRDHMPVRSYIEVEIIPKDQKYDIIRKSLTSYHPVRDARDGDMIRFSPVVVIPFSRDSRHINKFGGRLDDNSFIRLDTRKSSKLDIDESLASVLAPFNTRRNMIVRHVDRTDVVGVALDGFDVMNVLLKVDTRCQSLVLPAATIVDRGVVMVTVYKKATAENTKGDRSVSDEAIERSFGNY